MASKYNAKKERYWKAFDSEFQKKKSMENNKNRFGENGIYLANNSIYDLEGYDKYGYNADGFNRIGLHKVTVSNVNEEGLNANKNKPRDDINKLSLEELALMLSSGEITTIELLKYSNKPLSDIITYSKENGLDANVLKTLYLKQKDAQMYLKPFDSEEYLKYTRVIKDGNIIEPQLEDVDKCLEYMEQYDMYVSDKTVRDIVGSYLRDEMKLEKTPVENRGRKAVLNNKIALLQKAKKDLEFSEKYKKAAIGVLDDYKNNRERD